MSKQFSAKDQKHCAHPVHRRTRRDETTGDISRLKSASRPACIETRMYGKLACISRRRGGRELSSFRVDGHRGAAKGIYEAHSGVKVNG